METICGENGIVDGCQLLHSAYTMKSMMFIREENLKEALEILEDTYEKQSRKLKGCRAHPFLEQCLSQMGLLQKVTQQYLKAEESYKNLIKIKEQYYGEHSESLLITLKNLGSVQLQAEKPVEAAASLERGVKVANALIESGKAKDKNALKTHATETIFLLQSIYDKESPEGGKLDFSKLSMHEEVLKKVQGGEKTSQFAYFQFLKAKKLMMSGASAEETNLTIKKAIEIQEEIEATNQKKSPQLGRYYYFLGTTYKG